VNANVAIAAVLGTLEGDLSGTTALRVGNGGAARGAFLRLLAAGAVRHRILEVDVGVKLDSDLHLLDGEVLVGAARDLGRCGRVGCTFAFYDFLLSHVSEPELHSKNHRTYLKAIASQNSTATITARE
jgi:hypothetical protein